MFDEMPNDALLKYTAHNEDATELELELADRLRTAIGEINHLVETIKNLEEAYGNA